MNGVEYAALSEQLSFLFPAVAGICLVCLLARCLKPDVYKRQCLYLACQGVGAHMQMKREGSQGQLLPAGIY